MAESKIVSIIREKGPIDVLALAEELAKASPNSGQAKDYLNDVLFSPRTGETSVLRSKYEHFWVQNLYSHLTPLREAGRVVREKVGKRWVYSVGGETNGR